MVDGTGLAEALLGLDGFRVLEVTESDAELEQAAEALALYLGTRWSVANFSAIERSVDGGHIRQFTADDLLALSRGFGLPIGFFLTPPGDDPRGVRIATPDTRKEGGADSMVLLDAVLGTEESLKVWEGVLATIGWAAGNWGAIIDGKLVNKGAGRARPTPPGQATGGA